MDSVVDLDEPITSWAKYHLEITDEKLISGEVRLEIDSSKIRQSTCGMKVSNITARTSPSVVTYDSTYRNNTDAPQEHVFIMEKTTQATVTTSLKKGFMRNGSVGLKIEVPESVRQAIGDFGSHVTIHSEEENTVQHSLKWAIKSKVNVPPETSTVGKLIVTERRSDFSFEGKVVQKGKILAKAYNTETGRAWQTEGYLAGILAVKKFNGGFNVPKHAHIDDKDAQSVTWKVQGSINFRFGISQDFQVDYEKEDEQSFSESDDE